MPAIVVNGKSAGPKCPSCGSVEGAVRARGMSISRGRVVASGIFSCAKCGHQGEFSIDEGGAS